MSDQNLENQTDTQVIPPSDEVPAWVLAVNSANARAKQLEDEVMKLRQNVPAPTPEPEITLERGDAFDNPDKLLNALEARINKQVAPIAADLAQQKRATQMAQVKQYIRSNFPIFAPVFSQIEPFFDAEIANKELSEPNIVAAIETAYGRALMRGAVVQPNNTPAPVNNTPAPAPVNNNTSANVPANIPAHMRPSNSAPRNSFNEPKPLDINDFDENERRLMREKGMSPEEFVALRDTDPRELKKVYAELKAKGMK